MLSIARRNLRIRPDLRVTEILKDAPEEYNSFKEIYDLVASSTTPSTPIVNSASDLTSPEAWVTGEYNSEDDSKNTYTVSKGTMVATLQGDVYVYTADTVNAESISNPDSWRSITSSGSNIHALNTTDTNDYEDVF